MGELVQNIFLWGVIVGGGAFVIICCAVSGFKRRKFADDQFDEAKFTTITTRATVVDQACCVKTIGYKNPKTIQEFTITFQAENGEFIRLNVPEEMYDGFEKNQTGMLTVVDGQLYGFELLDDSAF